MSGRADRGINREWTAIVLLAVLIALTAAGLYVWRRVEASRVHDMEVKEQTVQAKPSDAARPDAMLTVMVYSPTNGGMVAQPVRIRHHVDTQLLAKEAVSAVLSTEAGSRPVVLGNFRLKALYLDHSGTAYVDLSPVTPGGNIYASAWQELIALYAIVNTLTENFEEIKSVRFLLDGKEAKTLAGHISLAGYFERRQDLTGH